MATNNSLALTEHKYIWLRRYIHEAVKLKKKIPYSVKVPKLSLITVKTFDLGIAALFYVYSCSKSDRCFAN